MDQLIPAVTALIAGLGALLAALAKKHAKQANDAVNRRHVTGTPRIYDMVLDLHTQAAELVQWKRSYDGGPLDSGEKVERFVERIDQDIHTLREDVTHIRENCQHCQDESPPPAA